MYSHFYVILSFLDLFSYEMIGNTRLVEFVYNSAGSQMAGSRMVGSWHAKYNIPNTFLAISL